jgi:23S rRNA (pseudouridine1915-N3)-methyltransferase
MKIRLLFLGKTRRAELCTLLDEYVKRIARSCPMGVTEVRDAAAALKKLDVDRAATAVLLDAGGKSYDSEGFAKWLRELRDRGTREIIFVCGDADGFPNELRERVKQKISLSPMTYSHELARVMLAEQIYRAFAILSGSPYPK